MDHVFHYLRDVADVLYEDSATDASDWHALLARWSAEPLPRAVALS